VGDLGWVIKPEALRPGDTIGLIAPAGPVREKELEDCIRMLSGFGYPVKIGRSAGKAYGYLAGKDSYRKDDLEAMFLDPEVKAVFCLRGGYGSLRIIDRIDYEVIRRHPKIFVGYSDITALHIAIRQICGLVTYHGPMGAELSGERYDEESWNVLFSVLAGRDVESYAPNEHFFSIVPGVAEGELTGGNLSLLRSAVGTPYEVETRDKILLLEDVNEEVYAIDCMLNQLRLAGKFEHVRGVILSDFRLAEPDRNKPSIPFREMIETFFTPLGIPCFYGLSAGHCRPNFTLPIGGKVRMDSTRGRVQIIEPPVIPT
jgi:muramoyltetrapeptide carboxypeptidase